MKIRKRLVKTPEGRIRLLPEWMMEEDLPRRKPATRRGVRLEEFALYSPPRPAREKVTLIRCVKPDGRVVIQAVRLKIPEKAAGFLWEPET